MRLAMPVCGHYHAIYSTRLGKCSKYVSQDSTCPTFYEEKHEVVGRSLYTSFRPVVCIVSELFYLTTLSHLHTLYSFGRELS